MGKTQKNNEIKGVMGVMNSLKNSGVLLKETSRKITSQEGWFLNFLRMIFYH